MFEELAKLVGSGNFIQGGGVIMALAEIGVLIYVIKLLISVMGTNNKQVATMNDRMSTVIEQDSVAKIRLAETMALHSKSIEGLAATIERKL